MFSFPDHIKRPPVPARVLLTGALQQGGRDIRVRQLNAVSPDNTWSPIPPLGSASNTCDPDRSVTRVAGARVLSIRHTRTHTRHQMTKTLPRLITNKPIFNEGGAEKR